MNMALVTITMKSGWFGKKKNKKKHIFFSLHHDFRFIKIYVNSVSVNFLI